MGPGMAVIKAPRSRSVVEGRRRTHYHYQPTDGIDPVDNRQSRTGRAASGLARWRGDGRTGLYWLHWLHWLCDGISRRGRAAEGSSRASCRATSLQGLRHMGSMGAAWQRPESPPNGLEVD
jgi:hypothetical protein